MISAAPPLEATRTITRRLSFTADRSRRLTQMADIRQTSEDEVVARALDLYFSLADFFDGGTKRQDWHLLSEPALRGVWDNEYDAVYDDWKALYGVSEG